MKADVLTEIRKEYSRIRVIFATTALGMGVNILNVSKIIHIGPPSSLEAYMQEIGRACCSGSKSICAIMYYNNSDISKNKDIINDSIREYCTSENTCLRKMHLNYFGFESNQQMECCVICNGSSAVSFTEQTISQRVSPLK
jgi:superfamily II DNA helicase RecQ